MAKKKGGRSAPNSRTRNHTGKESQLDSDGSFIFNPRRKVTTAQKRRRARLTGTQEVSFLELRARQLAQRTAESSSDSESEHPIDEDLPAPLSPLHHEEESDDRDTGDEGDTEELRVLTTRY